LGFAGGGVGGVFSGVGDCRVGVGEMYVGWDTWSSRKERAQDGLEKAQISDIKALHPIGAMGKSVPLKLNCCLLGDQNNS